MQWAKERKARFLPADPVIFPLYPVFLIQQARSVSSVNSTVYGVDWVQKKNDYR